MELFTLDNMSPLFDMLENCKGVEQMAKHHPEGDVFVHSVQVMNFAFRESLDVDCILAAMLHDIGKAINSDGHEGHAVEILQHFCSPKTLFLIEHHMRIKKVLSGEMRRKSKVAFLLQHPWLPELVQLTRWDTMGRVPHASYSYGRQYVVDKLNNAIDEKFKLNTKRSEKL